MGKIAVIGGGISGATCAQILRANGHQTVVYEKKEIPGGLIKCTIEDGNLFHRVGGHVFNSQDPNIANWFWSKFDKEREFLFAKRNATIHMNRNFIGYPVEQHLYQMEADKATKIVSQLLELRGNQLNNLNDANFYDFLLSRFGETLCEDYFIPYNTKIWNLDLRQMPVTWLAGKLPMPTVDEIVMGNIMRASEKSMVHAHFFYPKQGGSQFIIDRLLQGIEVRTHDECRSINTYEKLEVNDENYDALVYTGDIREISRILGTDDPALEKLANLKSNGTTTVLCSCDANPYSWVYIPDQNIACHRMIMTGNFSASNNSPDLPANRTTCTVEFVGNIDQASIDLSLRSLPLNPIQIAVNFEPKSYVIQEMDSRETISAAREKLKQSNIWICGRFAEWEYYNMDEAIASAMRVTSEMNARIN